ncbi:polysaccharide pyruvyl transferase family protein [Halochromatium glycolicum]|uniref:Polysaccharide pyruvyl transferase domain-containing protein n=1 Tax=Halochromatium glycolicum TaxID=85075 RepID=A0AAJ0XBQ0_9GAMM|nr:polysaccharide pyruvyl transferase family protein [Halochromatium glycolicum]MBK1706370.1 hypothetical protein [Halochromatium glycolicum]
MRRIGILTFVWGYNPGTLLQADAVRILFQRRFPDAQVSIINYQPGARRRKPSLNVFGMRNARRTWQVFRQTRAFDQFRRGRLGLVSTPVRTHEYRAALASVIAEDFDAIVVGSDQVWEITPDDRKVPVPFPNVFWLGPEVPARKYACAASAGATDTTLLPDPTREQVRTLAANFDLVGVRDEITESMMRDFAVVEAERIVRMPDPTFGVDFPETSIAARLRTRGLDLERPIVGVGLADRLGIRRIVVEELLSRDYQILSIGQAPMREREVVDSPAISPYEWADVFRFLTLTITDRFHASVFSLKHAVPFIGIDLSPHRMTSGGASKIETLVKEIGIPAGLRFAGDEVAADPTRLTKAIDSLLSDYDRKQVVECQAPLRNRIETYLDRVAQIEVGDSRTAA